MRMDLRNPENLQFQALDDAVREMNAWSVTVSGRPSILVSKDGRLVSPNDVDELIPCTADSLAVALRVHLEPGRYGKKEYNAESDSEESPWIPVPKVPRDLVRAYLDAKQYFGVPRIQQVACAPIVRPDFSIRWAKGWDEATGTWITPGLEPDTRLIDAGQGVRALFTEFALTDRRQEADCLAAALTPLLRIAISGSLPAFIATAHKPGSGKSELTQLLARIGGAGGDTVTRWPDRAEFTKTVSAYVASDEPAVIFDNIRARIESPDLESVITSRQTSFRVMRTHDVVKMRSNTVWFLTINGAYCSPDMLRRSIVVLLDPERAPAPWSGEVPQKTKTYEAALVTLMCSLIESWRDAGCPRGGVTHPGFEEWSQTVSGILEHAGIAGMWEARAEVIGEAVAVDGDEDGNYLERIVRLMGDMEFAAIDLWEAADGQSFNPDAKTLRDWLGSSKSAGHALRSLKERTFEGCAYKLKYQRSNGKSRWWVESLDGTPVPAPLFTAVA